MAEVLLNPITKRAIDGFLAKPAHAVMLSGAYGMGKGYVAQYLASQLLGITFAEVLAYPYVTVIEPEKNTISIDHVRAAQKLLSLRVPGTQTIKRIIIIENAQAMTIEAQNALLKALEEPPADSVIIVTVTDERLLLPTIVSRLQRIAIRPLNNDALKALSADTRQQAIASGRPGLLWALAHNADHPLVAQIAIAKGYLTQPSYERLITAQDIKDRETADLFLQALHVITQAALHNPTHHANKRYLAAWHKRGKRILLAQKQLAQNASVKLLLTDLSLSL